MARKEFKNSQFDEKNGRMRRKRVSPLTIAKLDYVDYKDTDLLNKFLSERSKIKARHNSGNDAQQQRAVARAIKNAREMALMPYIAAVTTQRRERRQHLFRLVGQQCRCSIRKQAQSRPVQNSRFTFE